MSRVTGMKDVTELRGTASPPNNPLSAPFQTSTTCLTPAPHVWATCKREPLPLGLWPIISLQRVFTPQRRKRPSQRGPRLCSEVAL